MTRQKNVNSEFRSFGVTVTDGLQGGHTLLPLQVAANTLGKLAHLHTSVFIGYRLPKSSVTE